MKRSAKVLDLADPGRVERATRSVVPPAPYNAVVLALVEALVTLDQRQVRGMVRHPMDGPTR